MCIQNVTTYDVYGTRSSKHPPALTIGHTMRQLLGRLLVLREFSEAWPLSNPSCVKKAIQPLKACCQY